MHRERHSGGMGRIPCRLDDSLLRGEVVAGAVNEPHLKGVWIARQLPSYQFTRLFWRGDSNIPERDIQIRPWDVLGKDLPDSRLERLHLIAKDGFPAPLGKVVTDRAALLATLNTLLTNNKTSDVNADGVVLKIDSVKASETLGCGSNYANFQICFKPQSAKGETHLREVIWQVGRSGKLTPVGILDPVTLAGAVITRVNLNNISYIRDMKLKIGSRVSLVRSGDVIPVVERVLDEDGE